MMVPALATSVVVIFTAILTVLGQNTRPTEGYYIGNAGFGFDIIMPLSIAQCEPVLIYYNITGATLVGVALHTPELYIFLTLYFPRGVGYLDWICDIPAGHTFTAYAFLLQTFTVQPGSSSGCLGEITTTYPYVYYQTTHFQSYTQQTYSGSYTNYQL